MSTIAPTLPGRMLCASGLAYSVPDTSKPINPPNSNIPQTAPFYIGAGYKTPPNMIASDAKDANAACTVGMNTDGIILAFRGTYYTSITDWINDLLMEMVTVKGIPGKVHDGFNNAVSVIIAPIISTIKQLQKTNPTAPLFITGHSKGGGMAPIAAAYLANAGIKAKALYLFAPPLPGDSKFVNAFNTAFPSTFLYENYQDIVPVLPPSPTTAGELDYYFYEWGTTEADAAAVMITIMGLLGYQAVGSMNNTYYIPQPVNSVYKLVKMTNTVAQQQLQGIEAAITAEDFQAFENAHSHECGFGYMSAICPTVCH